MDGSFEGGRGTYLFAARKSYLGYLVRRFNDQFQYTNNPPVLSFADGHGKVIYDLTKRDYVGFSLILCDFNFDSQSPSKLARLQSGVSSQHPKLPGKRLLGYDA